MLTRILVVAALATGLTAGVANASSHQHDETTTQHTGKTTQPAMGAKPAAPAPTGGHDETTTQHTGKTTQPAMGAKPSAPVKKDYHDETTSDHLKKK